MGLSFAGGPSVFFNCLRVDAFGYIVHSYYDSHTTSGFKVALPPAPSIPSPGRLPPPPQRLPPPSPVLRTLQPPPMRSGPPSSAKPRPSPPLPPSRSTLVPMAALASSQSAALSGQLAHMAVDGLPATYSSTLAQSRPWWAVDLGLVQPVNAVYITLPNYVGFALASLHSVQVQVGGLNPAGPTTPLCASKAGPLGTALGQRVQLACAAMLKGRYVTITIK